MVQVPTNYRMGTGLAATILGQQAGLEAEQQGLANTIKAMQMPQEALKGEEAAMLMQDPNYLQQKTANTLIELRNQYSTQDFQETLNAANRVKLELDAAGGDPAREQQVIQKALLGAKIDPSSEFYQFAMKQPRKALEMFIQGTEASMAGAGNKFQGERVMQGMKDTAAMERQTAGDTAAMERARLQANTSLAGQKYSADKGLTGNMLGYAKDLRGELDNINTNITKLESKEMDTAIFDAFRQSGKKDVTQADVDKYKSEQLTTLRNRKTEVENDLNEARGAVRGRIGLGQKQGAGTKENPIKL